MSQRAGSHKPRSWKCGYLLVYRLGRRVVLGNLRQ